jgi:hypothetical protein
MSKLNLEGINRILELSGQKMLKEDDFAPVATSAVSSEDIEEKAQQIGEFYFDDAEGMEKIKDFLRNASLPTEEWDPKTLKVARKHFGNQWTSENFKDLYIEIFEEPITGETDDVSYESDEEGEIKAYSDNGEENYDESEFEEEELEK